MTTIQILITLLIISIMLNGLALWFIRSLLSKLLFVSNNLGEVNEVMTRFAEHVEGVYSMETFYGDQTLQ